MTINLPLSQNHTSTCFRYRNNYQGQHYTITWAIAGLRLQWNLPLTER